MYPEEVIGKFVSFELMIKDSKHIVNLEQGTTCRIQGNGRREEGVYTK
jgi:hypothetical protein